jgi:hypothetical protein
MSAKQEIWADRERGETIQLTRAPTPEAIQILSRTVWGSHDLRYRILDIDAKLGQLRDAYFFCLSVDDHLASVCVLDRCEKRVLGRSFDAFHCVMAATDESFRDRGCASLLLGHIRTFCERTLRSPGLAFAYIEASTKFSLRLSGRVGHAVEAEMPLVLFSRMMPRAALRVRTAIASDRDELVEKLNALYEDHDFTDFEASVRPERTLVICENDRITAAAQFEVLHWSVASLPGISGSLLLRLLPLIPGLKRVLNPRDLRFIRVGNVLVEPGCEGQLVSLLETGLARHRVVLALIAMDCRSPVLARILAHGRLGPLRSVMPGAAKLHLDFFGLDRAVIDAIAVRPKHFSAADVF